MSNEEWLEWMDDLNFNMNFIKVKVTIPISNQRLERTLSEISMKDGLPYVILWARQLVHKEDMKKSS